MATITLIDILLQNNRISVAQAEAFRDVLKKKRITEEEALLEKLPEDVVFEVKGIFYGLPVKKCDDDYIIPIDVLSEISEEAAKTYQFIALARIDNETIEVGIVNPQDISVFDTLKFALMSKGLNAKIFLITPKQFNTLFRQYSSLRGEVKEALEGLQENVVDIDAMAGSEEAVSTDAITHTPIARIVWVIFNHAFEGRASDVHIEPLDKNTRVRFRIDGVLHTSLFLPKSIHAAVISRIKILTNMKIDESRIPQDGRFRSRISGSIIDFRVSTFPTINGEKIVMRLLDPFAGIKTLEELGFAGSNLDMVKRAITKPYGMILITGPTGSGKSTTLQSIISLINNEGLNLVSLEDPVEYNIEGVNQSPVRLDLGYTYANGLRSILRQDPDMVMIGEVRDMDTAKLVVHAALTGHVVLTTLHTNDAIGVIPRLINMGVESYLVPSAVTLSVAQRLVGRLCVDCKHKIPVEGKAKEIITTIVKSMSEKMQATLPSSDAYTMYEARGCGKCMHKGKKERIALIEALEMTPELKNIIMENMTDERIRQEAVRQNMLTMKQDGIIKVLSGIISLEDVLQSTV